MSDKTRFERLLALGDEAVAEIKGRLARGDSAREVAEWLQSEGRCLDARLEALVNQLGRFRRAEVVDAAIERLERRLKHSTHPGIALKKLSALARLTLLVEVQRERVEKALAQEDKLESALLQMASEAIRDYRICLVELARLQLETGILPRAPRSVAGRIQQTDNGLEFGWAEGVDAHRAATRRAFELIAEGVWDDLPEEQDADPV
jgi:hypothetical protein